MTDPADDPAGTSGRQPPDRRGEKRPAAAPSRAERQAAALRENLRRRKDQARQRGDREPRPPAGDDSGDGPRE